MTSNNALERTVRHCGPRSYPGAAGFFQGVLQTLAQLGR